MRSLLLALLISACTRAAEGPVCGLHAASEAVTIDGRALAVGARLMPGDRIKAADWALLECFGGALKVLDGQTVRVGDLKESKVEGTTIPRFVLKDGKAVPANSLPPAMSLRYSDNRFTPLSALVGSSEPTSGDYFRAFFSPNGVENMVAGGPRGDGPSTLPPPSQRVKIDRVHAGPLGEGGARLEVTDDVVFAETDDHATAALLDGKTYELGRTSRLIIPDGAEATLRVNTLEIDLEGPMDLRL